MNPYTERYVRQAMDNEDRNNREAALGCTFILKPKSNEYPKMKHLTERQREQQHELESSACNDREAARWIVSRVERAVAPSFPGIHAYLIGSVSVNGHGSDVDILIGPAPGEDEWRWDDMQAVIDLLAKEYGMASISLDYNHGDAGTRGRYSYEMITGRSESKMLNFILVSRGVERWLKADDLLRFIASTGQHVFKGVRVGVHRMIVDEAAPC